MTVSGMIHTCVSEVYKDAILWILCMGLPIITTITDEWLNCLIFHGDTKCITANGQMIIYVIWLLFMYISHDDYSSYCIKILEALNHS